MKRGAGGDLTILIDQVSETAILDSLRHDLGEQSFVFVSEELGEATVEGDEPRPIVICDPLDGSHNAQVGIPLSSLSLAVLGVRKQMRPSRKRHFGDVDVALVQSIMTDDEYFGLRGQGAYHNGKSLTRSRASKESERIETLGIECSDVDYFKELITRLTKKRVNKLRALGSVAMSLSLLAEGGLDALIFAQPGGARSIDSAAGCLIAKEAGCIFSDLAGGKKIDSVEVGFHSRVNILGARSERIHREIVRLVHEL